MENIYNIVGDEMSMVNDIILGHLKADEPLVEVISKYLVTSPSKRLRPLLTILSSKLFGYQGNAHILLAASVELIHAATLLHDDVVDNSTMRRFKETANILWGNKTSILVGDFLFAQAFKLMVDAKSLESLNSLSNASAIIAEGEVMQLVKLGENRIISEEEYNLIIYAKTAQLFSAACEVGAIISNQTDDTITTLKTFGHNFGTIFQIIDDLLDYFGDSKNMGKNLGDDFLEGKITLPVILSYNQSSADEKIFWNDTILNGNRNEETFTRAMSILNKHCIKEQMISKIHNLVNDTAALLDNVECDLIYKKCLLQLTQYSLSRCN